VSHVCFPFFVDTQLFQILARQGPNNPNPAENKMLLMKMSAPVEKPGVNALPSLCGAPAEGDERGKPAGRKIVAIGVRSTARLLNPIPEYF
jgi:hypothetical protein